MELIRGTLVKKRIIKEGVKQQLLEGARILHDAVSTTLGPKGENAVIQTYGEPLVTHDGVTVANSIEIEAEDASAIGLEMVKVSSNKNNDNVGDGTTSATILAYNIVKEGMHFIDSGKNSMILRKEIEVAALEAMEELDRISKPVTTEKEAINIATISSQDEAVGKTVGKLFHKLGKGAQVSIERAEKLGVESKIVEGYTFNNGLSYPHMVRDKKTQSTTLDSPAILVSSKPLGMSDIATITQKLYSDGIDQILLITDELKGDLVVESQRNKGKFDIIAVRAPGFGDNRLELLEDIAKLCNTKVYNGSQSFIVADLGCCDKVIASQTETVIYGGEDVSEYVKELEVKLKEETSEYEKEKLIKRIAALRSQIGILKVGALTEMADDELKRLVDDAVSSTESAMKEGYVPGGGMTYIQLSKAIKGDSDGAKTLREALHAPFRVLMDNSGEQAGVVLKSLENEPFGMGMNVLTGEIVDLVKDGVIDSTSVIKNALKNSVSVAGSILTSGVAVLNEKEKHEEED